MPAKAQMGNLAMQATTPQIVHVSPSTCQDLTLFKEILKEYRRLDDTIMMRLNRANATMRDRQRAHDSSNNGNAQDQACSYIWRELVGNWQRRTQLVEYCSSVVEQTLNEKRSRLDGEPFDLTPATRRKIQGTIFADEVKRKQVRNESAVEEIVRRRSIEAFRSRCQLFDPPISDIEARKVWDAALR